MLSKPKAPLGLPLSPDQWLYFLTLAVLVILFWLGANLLRGRVGRAIVAIRDNHISAEAMGINSALYKSLVFGVSAAYTGVAGALSASVIAFVAPDSFNVFLSITLLIGSVIGGLASISGAIFGAFFIQFVPNWAQDISKAAPWAIFGVFLIVFMYVMPFGIAGAVGRIWIRMTCSRVLQEGRDPAPAHHAHTTTYTEDSMTRTRKLLIAVLAVGLAGLIPALAAAQTVVGVTATEIKIGNTNPYSGPASAYGTIGKVIGAYFKKVNDEGGIIGRKINYITYDDGYSPPKTVEMVRRLVEQDQVAFVFQTLGTPTNSAIHKYVNQEKVPHLFVATGATKWNDPKNFPWTMGFQPNYQTEGRVYSAHVLKNHPDAKVGILYQNDDYGKDYLKGFEDGLGEAAKKMIVLKQSHEVTDPTIDSQIVNLKNSGATVFFNITIPKFAVQAIKKSHDIGWKPVHYLNNVSSSLATVLKPAGLEASRGLITALYMKEVTDPQWKNDKGFQDWVAFMKKYYPEGALDDQANGYGYNVAILVAHTLRQCGNDLSRENIIRQAANLKNVELPLLLPGIKVNTSPTDHAPIEQEQLARFDGERWVTFGELFDAFRKQ